MERRHFSALLKRILQGSVPGCKLQSFETSRFYNRPFTGCGSGRILEMQESVLMKDIKRRLISVKDGGNHETERDLCITFEYR